jgi:hypothetical protein
MVQGRLQGQELTRLFARSAASSRTTDSPLPLSREQGPPTG